MRHYEIVLLVHPDQSDQVPSMLERYRHTIEGQKGIVHRLESSGRRQLTYQIKKVHKAHYAVINVECDEALLAQLDNTFRFNDAIIRYLITRVDTAITEPSVLSKEGAVKAAEKGAEEASESASADSSSKEEGDFVEEKTNNKRKPL